MISRRAFLGTMLAAGVGAAANFDPVKGLWVPGPVEGAPAPEILIPGVTWTKAIVDETADLSELARLFAHEMGDRLQNHRAVALRNVMLRQVGHINLGTLLLDGADERERGHFQPSPHRGLVHEVWNSRDDGGARVHLDRAKWAASVLRRKAERFDMFAPIGTDLRAGVPFTDCLVGVGTDEESGLSARALRFKTTDGVIHTEVEMAGGDWIHNAGGSRAPKYLQRDVLLLSLASMLSPDFLEADETASESQPSLSAHVAESKAGISMRYLNEWDIEKDKG